MIFSEITISDVAAYLKFDNGDLYDNDVKKELETYLVAAKRIVKKETALSDDECDKEEDLTLAVFLLCEDMYDNRSAQVDSKQSFSPLLKKILGLHCRNFL